MKIRAGKAFSELLCQYLGKLLQRLLAIIRPARFRLFIFANNPANVPVGVQQQLGAVVVVDDVGLGCGGNPYCGRDDGGDDAFRTV